jgi:predicted secreted protein
MKKLVLLFVVAVQILFASGHAMAADAADRAIVGFSKDGSHFAFEEYGVQDGSGFPYSNIYIINLEKDEWVKGSPIRVVVRDEKATSYTARHQALTEAAPLIEKHGTVQPARLLASNAVGEEVADPHTMTFKRFHNLPKLWTVKLTNLDLDLPPECQSLPAIKGFALSVSVDNKKPTEVYRDSKLPESRGCPENYRLADIIAHGESETAKVVVMIHKLTYGFEGRDVRFVTVPIDLPSWR